tara:strand:- start:141 stop:443 length:303 start_codon:yes stop_codon:yes gene_type:complete
MSAGTVDAEEVLPMVLGWGKSVLVFVLGWCGGGRYCNGKTRFREQEQWWGVKKKGVPMGTAGSDVCVHERTKGFDQCRVYVNLGECQRQNSGSKVIRCKG